MPVLHRMALSKVVFLCITQVGFTLAAQAHTAATPPVYQSAAAVDQLIVKLRTERIRSNRSLAMAAPADIQSVIDRVIAARRARPSRLSFGAAAQSAPGNPAAAEALINVRRAADAGLTAAWSRKLSP
ncbi:hypothetical protein [Burkholderia ubonensis]|uniref:hypothetical protein n=1 Tax=Burkholderia ubonensis TaxID=101571 RepID=UPI000AD727D0|nr:hypothetical protein [Burkholderia ubonensis]